MLQAADCALESASRSRKKTTSEADGAAIKELHEFSQGFYERDRPITARMEAAEKKDRKLRNVLTGKVHAKVCISRHTLRECIYHQQFLAKPVTINQSHHILHPQVPSWWQIYRRAT